MKIENGKIIEATEQELWQYWCNRELYDAVDWHSYFAQMKSAGVKILKEN